jgi:hypothetical protein
MASYPFPASSPRRQSAAFVAGIGSELDQNNVKRKLRDEMHLPTIGQTSNSQPPGPIGSVARYTSMIAATPIIGTK